MIYTNDYVVKLVGFSIFELWIHTSCLVLFTLLLTLKIDGGLPLTWGHTFIPLFLADGLHLYFSLIVCIRTVASGKRKEAYKRVVWAVMCLSLLFLCKMLTYQLLENGVNFKKVTVLAPIFAVWVMLLVRACHIRP
uniref:Transmembrane protein 203-like n=1 Tax=Ciona intestinalis TaxID=7719 RepID=F6XY64_CIOIN